MKNNTLFIGLFLLILNGCANYKQSKDININTQTQVPIKEHTVLAVLWQQNAAEYRALCHQAFNIARYRLNEIVANNKSVKPLAIITDIDETILDNSPYSSHLILNDQNFNKESWITWGKKESAHLVPGAAEFINHAANLGVEIFYVSNRYDVQLNETINNLNRFQLANADKDHVLLRSETSGKEDRRQKIKDLYEVVLLLGDNLSDFDDVYDEQNSEQRNQHVKNMKDSFGSKFIVFPNPMYGDWETKGVYEGKSISEKNKNELRIKKLKQ